jgi:isocitrate dehydrogenase (NAD+)
MDAVVLILEAAGAPFDRDQQQGGMVAIANGLEPLPKTTLDSIRRTRLALKGPLTTPVGGGFRSINVRLREEFGLYANLRPVRTIMPGGRTRSPFRRVSTPVRNACASSASHYYSVWHDRKKVTVVHKANVLKVLTGIFLEAGHQVAKEYEGRVQMDDRIVDACAMQLVMNPWQFDVIVTTNLFGDIVSDQMAGLVGGLGVTPGANIGENAAIFEVVHGSAPDIAGKGVANPLSLLLAACLMLEHVGQGERAARIRTATEEVLRQDGLRTPDLGGKASTVQFAQAITRRLVA